MNEDLSLSNLVYYYTIFIHSYGSKFFNSQQSNQTIAFRNLKIFMLSDVIVCPAKYELQASQLQETLCFHDCSSFSSLK